MSQENTQFHIALFDLDKSGYDFVSDGDTIDENPCFSKLNNNIVYYNCKSIGRDNNGNLYYIKLPFKEKKKHSLILFDILLAPFRIIKALIGFWDIFTKRYSGQSLKTSGSPPVKANAKSEKDIFIEGNLINAEKTLKENKSSGEKYPGLAPKSRELHRLERDGTDICVKKGILDYDITHSGDIIYSNGHYIMKIDKSSEESLIEKANLVTKVISQRL